LSGRSLEAEHFLAASREWTERARARLELFSVVSAETTVFDLLEPAAVDRASDRARYLRELANVLPDAADLGYAVVKAREVGSAIVKHLQTTSSVGALATHARRGGELLMLGSVAMDVLAHSPSPLLSACRHRPPLAIDHDRRERRRS
jgi:nucleotide-binding universal stress UspA family protein